MTRVSSSLHRFRISSYHLNEKRRLDAKNGQRVNPTFEIHLCSTVFQFHAENVFSEGFMIMRDFLFRASTERQGIVIVGLLSIVIRADGVHPENNFTSVFVLKAANENERRQTSHLPDDRVRHP